MINTYCNANMQIKKSEILPQQYAPCISGNNICSCNGLEKISKQEKNRNKSLTLDKIQNHWLSSLGISIL